MWSSTTLAREEAELAALEQEAERLRQGLREKQEFEKTLRHLKLRTSKIRGAQLQDAARTQVTMISQLEHARAEVNKNLASLGERTQEREEELRVLEVLVGSLERLVKGSSAGMLVGAKGPLKGTRTGRWRSRFLSGILVFGKACMKGNSCSSVLRGRIIS